MSNFRSSFSTNLSNKSMKKGAKDVKKPSDNRRNSQREVAERRAEHFARADPKQPKSVSSTPTGSFHFKQSLNDGDAKESWPGPFSTARQLIKNRDAVRAAREKSVASKNEEELSTFEVQEVDK